MLGLKARKRKIDRTNKIGDQWFSSFAYRMLAKSTDFAIDDLVLCPAMAQEFSVACNHFDIWA